MAKAEYFVGLDGNSGGLGTDIGVHTRRHIEVCLAGNVALVVSVLAIPRFDLNGWQGSWAITQVYDSHGKLGALNVLFNDCNIAVNIGVDHRAVKFVLSLYDAHTLGRTGTRRLNHNWQRD